MNSHQVPITRQLKMMSQLKITDESNLISQMYWHITETNIAML